MSEQDQFSQTFAKLKRATDERPTDGLAWSALGDFLYEESDNPNLAARAYEKAQAFLPGKDLRLRLGSALVKAGDYSKGLSLIKASAEERPRAEAYCFLADAYLSVEKEKEAEGAARKAISLEPSFEEGYYLLGESLKKHDREQAIAAYQKALELSSGYALAWQGLGRELLLQGEVEKAVEALRKAVAIDGDDVWSRLFLANGLARLNKTAEADKEYRAAVALDPSENIQKFYEDFRRQTGNPSTA